MPHARPVNREPLAAQGEGSFLDQIISSIARSSPDPIELIDIAEIPGGGQLRLLRCDDDYSIQFGQDELMGSCDHVSEEALATMTRQRLGRRDGDVLIGGLGMGFTLGAALAAWSDRSSITVAELVPKVVTWARGPLAHIFRDHLSDPRLTIEVSDVHDVMAASTNRFDAILLDVDNGPDGMIQLENERLYSNWGLRSAHAALKCGGMLAIWSAYPAADFGMRLEDAGFEVEELGVPAFAGSKDEFHHIWFARRVD